MRIGLVGGGTGGHFYPLIAVAEELQLLQERPELFYFGPKAYNPEALSAQGITFISCPAGKVRRYSSIDNFFDFFRNIIGLLVAIIKLYIIMPDVIFSKGGYTSVPILLAARFYRIPVVIHESDSVPGRANMLAKKFARYIAVSYPETAALFPEGKTALIGIPIQRVLRQPHQNPFGALGLSPEVPLLFVTGGSSGAERVNNLVLDALDELLPNYQILHQVGSMNEGLVKQSAAQLLANNPLLERYFVVGSLSPELMSAAFSAASVIISRAGSTTIFEIARAGKPSIIIPIPEEISRDQRSNAFAYARTGAATVIEEKNLTDGILAAEIANIMSDGAHYQEMSAATKAFVYEDAAKKIADILISIGHEHGS